MDAVEGVAGCGCGSWLADAGVDVGNGVSVGVGSAVAEGGGVELTVGRSEVSVAIGAGVDIAVLVLEAIVAEGSPIPGTKSASKTIPIMRPAKTATRRCEPAMKGDGDDTV